MSLESDEQAAKKRFDAEDKNWGGPKFVGLAVVTLVICISTIYGMSTVSGCSLAPQPEASPAPAANK
jgi:hypothetical protein